MSGDRHFLGIIPLQYIALSVADFIKQVDIHVFQRCDDLACFAHYCRIARGIQTDRIALRHLRQHQIVPFCLHRLFQRLGEHILQRHFVRIRIDFQLIQRYGRTLHIVDRGDDGAQPRIDPHITRTDRCSQLKRLGVVSAIVVRIDIMMQHGPLLGIAADLHIVVSGIGVLPFHDDRADFFFLAQIHHGPDILIRIILQVDRGQRLIAAPARGRIAIGEVGWVKLRIRQGPIVLNAAFDTADRDRAIQRQVLFLRGCADAAP